MRPYVVAERRDGYGHKTWSRKPEVIRRAFKRSTAETLLPAFEAVVDSGGTAERAAVEGLRIAGKTGTAQKAENGTYARGKYRASFVGFFPAEDPQVAIIVVLDEPKKSGYGGVVSAPIFSQIARRWVSSDPSLSPTLKEHLRPFDEPRLDPRRGESAPLLAARTFVRPVTANVDESAGPNPAVRAVTAASVVSEQAASSRRVPDESGSSDPVAAGWSCRETVTRLVADGHTVRVKGMGRVVRVVDSGDTKTVNCK
jgi:cell division protein FtsI (penicillin-binding protein 3)